MNLKNKFNSRSSLIIAITFARSHITAGSADGPAPLLATLVCAVLGAIAFETLATNKVPPIPDPLLGGVWGSLHALVRGPSKATGLAATSAFAAVKTLVAEQLEKS